MIRFRLYFDKDAETDWLNDMSARGWAMTHFFAGFYTFERCECGQYTYQVDFGNQFFSISQDYREFMEEAGVEIVQSWGFWIILRKVASQGEFKLYTDVESSIEHYTKIRKMFKVATIIEILCLCMVGVSTCIEENPYGIAYICLLGAIVLLFVNKVRQTTNTIHKLKERQTGIAAEGKRDISVLLSIGFLFNACSFLLQDQVSEGFVRAIQIVAIVFMLAGIWKTCRNRRK